jgi:hypothetical protein
LQPDHLAIRLGGIEKLAQSFAALSEQKPWLVTIRPDKCQQGEHASCRGVVTLARKKLAVPIERILVVRINLQNPAISVRGLFQFAGLVQLRRLFQYVCDRPQVEPPSANFNRFAKLPCPGCFSFALQNVPLYRSRNARDMLSSMGFMMY